LIEEKMLGRTAILTLNYPAKRNVLSRDMQRALLSSLHSINASDDIRAIILTGANGTFCSGGDIDAMNEVGGLPASREFFREMHELVRLLARCSKPIIAAVEGWAAGAGVGLALCADTIVAAENARFVAGFGRLSLTPDFGLFHSLPRRIGSGRARNFFLYDTPVGAEEAERIGMVDLVVPAGTTLEAALNKAAYFETAAPLAAAYVRAAFAAGLDSVLDFERETQAALLQTHDHAEGRGAFLEKRKANFTGS
jgi:2-(1,2-epoxy-1,2-dihydrophenyl)acetyl-CoA isomerase